jgi:pSer/pThr/pTyr-binding forkhead associated (FHA) protein
MHGELVPVGGGDPIPLLKKNLMVGRRESCDIVLRFSNVSAHHCQLTCNGGYWYVKDLKSRNGIKVNGLRVTEKRLDPGDELTVAKHRYDVRYSPHDLGAVGPPPLDDPAENIMKQSLLERAGLEYKSSRNTTPARDHEGSSRYDVLDDSEGQIKDPNRPV